MPPRLRAKEKHVEKFATEEERASAIRGYVVVLCCNLLSCGSLLAYATGAIDGAAELRWEILFLAVKTAVEVATGKFTTSLLLHHLGMCFGFALNQHASMTCWVFMLVHLQFVHVPFALRACWRLAMPELRVATPAARTRLDVAFWATWAACCAYRTPLVFGYCLYAARIGFTWQPAVGALCGCVLAHLDYEWTRAMLPKAEPGYFRPVAGGAAAFGLSAAVLALLTDALPGLMETYEGLVFPGPVRAPVRTCLAAEGYF